VTRRDVLVVVVVSSVVAASAFGFLGRDKWSAQPFDARQWREQPAERGRMADDLLERELEIGMPRTAVVRLLGEPDDTFPDPDGGVPRREDVYDLGRYRDQRHDELSLTYTRGALSQITPPVGEPIGFARRVDGSYDSRRSSPSACWSHGTRCVIPAPARLARFARYQS
jgi:hypothetical protein